MKKSKTNVGECITRPHIEENAKNIVGADSISAQKGRKGITLIALIITIIVMLILVMVSISIALNTGLFDAAGKATQKTNIAKEEEKELASGKVNIDGTIYDSIDEFINRTPKIGAGERATETSVYSDGTKTAIIPTGFTVSNISSEKTIDGGLVIYDIPEADLKDSTKVDWTNPDAVKTNYNQFVWIPVSNINSMVMCQEHATSAILTYNTESEKLECDLCKENNIPETEYCGKAYASGYWGNCVGESFEIGTTGQTYDATVGLREPAVLATWDSGGSDGYVNDSNAQTTERSILVIYNIRNNKYRK